METKKTIICSKCLEKIDDERICPLCGNDTSVDNPPMYLKCFTILQDKYIIGKLISYNGEHAFYIAFDTEQKNKVIVKEFAPTVMYGRLDNGTLEVKSEYEAQFKSLMADFYDLHKKLAVLKNDALMPVNEILGENNTVYIVYKYEKIITLEGYLSSLGEDMTYEETLDMFIPFLESLSDLHNEGIVHYGISPETIFVDKHCKLYLMGFDTQTGRTLKSDLDVELFDGFSAPEQYSLKNWLGTWTDVYSIASVLYYCLTGIRPPRAIERHKRDTLVPCHGINANVPRYVSSALEKAMNISTDARTQTVKDFVHGITVADKPSVIEKLSAVKEFVPTRKDKNAEKKASDNATYKQFPYMLVSTIVTTVILCFCGVFLFRFLFGPQLDTFIEKNFGGHNTTIRHEDIKGNVPNFVGQKFSDVKSNKENRVLFTFEEKYEYNEEFAEGVIVFQTPDSSALIANTYKISFLISKGSQYTTVPDIISMDMSQAMTALTKAGITNFKFIQVEETGYSSGEVIICMPAVNSRFNKQTDYLEVICQK